MTMTSQEFADLRAMVAKVQDNALQPVLVAIVNQLGHASGLDAAEEDRRIADEAKKQADADAKAAQEQADKDNAEADAKLAQAKRDMFVAMFGDMNIPTNTVTANPGAAQSPATIGDAKASPAPKANAPASSATTPKDA